MLYLTKLWHRATAGTVLLTDRLSIVAAVVVPAFLYVTGGQMDEAIQAYIAWAILIAVCGSVSLRLLTAPYLIWRDDQKRISDLENRVNSPQQREREKLAELIAEQKLKAVEDITRVRRIIVDQSKTKEEKQQAFHGSEVYSDKFMNDPVFNRCWHEFYEACNAAFSAWSELEKAREHFEEGRVPLVQHMLFVEAGVQVDGRASDLVSYLLHGTVPPEPATNARAVSKREGAV